MMVLPYIDKVTLLYNFITRISAYYTHININTKPLPAADITAAHSPSTNSKNITLNFSSEKDMLIISTEQHP